MPTPTDTDGILWLGDAACHDRSRAGGKAAGLSRLAARHPVPAGFCVEASHAAAVGRCDGSLAAAVEAAYARLASMAGDEAPRVAVRSSATDEDGATLSFAGQYESYLNMRGSDAVFAAIERCVAAADAKRLRAYRTQHGLDAACPAIAVLVQHLIPADVSAVAFSANPLDGNPEEIVINASWGLGESVVGGTVTPDTWIVDRRTGMVTGVTIAAKRRMTVMAEHGTIEVDVPRIMWEQPAMEESQAQRIAALVTTLAGETGHPVDIECAYADGRLALLQCRAITALR